MKDIKLTRGWRDEPPK